MSAEEKSNIKILVTRLVIVVIASLLSLYAFMVYDSYTSVLAATENSVYNKLDGVVSSLKVVIDGNALEKVTSAYSKKDELSTSDQDSNYLAIHQLLRQVQLENGIETDIYTLFFEGEDSTKLYFGVTSGVNPYFRHIYESFPDDILKNYKTGSRVSPYGDEFGSWLTSFRSIKNSKDEVIGIVMVDMKFDTYEEKVFNEVLSQALLLLVVVVIVTLVLIYFMIKIVKEGQSYLSEIASSKQLLKEKTTLIANLSHEIRTPLNGVIGLTQLLSKTDLTDLQKKYLKSIDSSGNHLKSLVSEVLDLSKMEEDKMELVEDSFLLYDMCYEIGNLLYVTANEKRINLFVNVEDSLKGVWLKTDKIKMRQVLLNLVGNALKFTMNGEVNLKVDLVEKHSKGAKVKISIIDTGIGISKDKQEAIFKPFVQSTKDTSRVFGGTGLGLAISKNIVELMGGDIKVESKIGQGTTFYFELDIPYGEGDSSRLDMPFDNALVGKHILLIEDNEVNQLIAEKYLSESGATVQIASDGQVAMENVFKRKFDLLLVDLNIPLIDGYEVIEQTRKIKDYDDVPIVGLTGHTSRHVKERCLEVGANDLMTKPFEEDEFMNMVVSYVTGQSDIQSQQKKMGSDKLKGLKILVNEDNYVNQMVFEDVLLSEGAEVVMAENGEVGLNHYKEQEFDIILTDMLMPIMDGYDFSRNVRALEDKEKAAIKIIAVSAHAVKEEVQAFYDAGVDDYLLKPYEAEDLVSKILKYVKPKSESIDQYINWEVLDTKTKSKKVLQDKLVIALDESLVEAINELNEQKQAMIDWEVVGQIVHKIKPSLNLFGITQVFDHIATLQVNIKHEPLDNVRIQLFEDLIAHLKNILEELKGARPS